MQSHQCLAYLVDTYLHIYAAVFGSRGGICYSYLLQSAERVLCSLGADKSLSEAPPSAACVCVGGNVSVFSRGGG